jgi:ABC-type transport system substrate-binding protein
MNTERSLPPHGLLLITPRSVLLDADDSVWRLFHPNGFGGKYWTGSQPGQRFYELMEQARHTLDVQLREASYAEATRILHDEKPWLELFQGAVVYGVSKRVSFKPRPDDRLIVADMTVGGR